MTMRTKQQVKDNALRRNRRRDLARSAFEKAGLGGPAWRRARNRKIVQDSRGQDASSLSHEYGLSPSQVRRILRKAGR